MTPGFEPWVRKIPWRRKWLPTPVSLCGKSHGQRSLTGFSSWGHRVGHNWATNTISTLTTSCTTENKNHRPQGLTGSGPWLLLRLYFLHSSVNQTGLPVQHSKHDTASGPLCLLLPQSGILSEKVTRIPSFSVLLWGHLPRETLLTSCLK